MGKAGDPLEWLSPLHAKGKIEGLGLSGDFQVEFSFEVEELRNWLKEYIASKPEEAVRLLAEMHTEAVIALAHSGKNVESS